MGKPSSSQAKKARQQAGVYLNVHADSGGGDKLKHLLSLRKIVEAGKLKPVIDRVYALEQLTETHRYVDQGHKKGNVVVTIEGVAKLKKSQATLLRCALRRA